MTSNLFNLAFSLCLLQAILITACTTTIKRQKDPIFTKSTDTMKVELGTLFSCENLRVGGEEITTNGATRTELEIDVINGTRFPEAGDQQNALAKAIASYFKRALKDSAEYDTYKVLFVTETTQSGATVRKWTGKVFKSKEL